MNITPEEFKSELLNRVKKIRLENAKNERLRKAYWPHIKAFVAAVAILREHYDPDHKIAVTNYEKDEFVKCLDTLVITGYSRKDPLGLSIILMSPHYCSNNKRIDRAIKRAHEILAESRQ
jgi:hypothetical protein